MVLCGTHIYTYVLYIATELAQHFRHTAPPDDLLYFWLLFVLLNFLRFVVAVPIFVNALRRLVRRQVGKEKKRKDLSPPLSLRTLWPRLSLFAAFTAPPSGPRQAGALPLRPLTLTARSRSMHTDTHTDALNLTPCQADYAKLEEEVRNMTHQVRPQLQ